MKVFKNRAVLVYAVCSLPFLLGVGIIIFTNDTLSGAERVGVQIMLFLAGILAGGQSVFWHHRLKNRDF